MLQNTFYERRKTQIKYLASNQCYQPGAQWPYQKIFKGTWLAQSVVRAILNLRVVSSSPTAWSLLKIF